MRRFGKGWWDSLACLGSRVRDHRGLMAPGHPLVGTHPPLHIHTHPGTPTLTAGTYPAVGTALRGPFRQVRSTHEHMQVSLGTEECLCLYLLTPFNHNNVFSECVLYARSCSSGLGYTPVEIKIPQGLLFCRDFASGGMCEFTVHTYTQDEERCECEQADLG